MLTISRVEIGLLCLFLLLHLGCWRKFGGPEMLCNSMEIWGALFLVRSILSRECIMLWEEIWLKFLRVDWFVITRLVLKVFSFCGWLFLIDSLFRLMVCVLCAIWSLRLLIIYLLLVRFQLRFGAKFCSCSIFIGQYLTGQLRFRLLLRWGKECLLLLKSIRLCLRNSL